MDLHKIDGHEIERLLKIRSESVGLKGSGEIDNSTAQQSLPRGEYVQAATSPRKNKNLVKLKPIDSPKKNNSDTDDSFESSLQNLDRIGSRTTSDSSAATSEENTPSSRSTTKKLSSFSSRKIIDASEVGKSPQNKEKGKPADNYYTPKIAKKQGTLYKLTIMQNASKPAVEQIHPHTTTNVKSEEMKSDLSRRLAEVAKSNETKSASLKQVSSYQNLAAEEKPKTEVTFSGKNLVFGPKVDDKILKKHINLVLRGLNYSLKLLKPPPMSYIQSRQIILKDLKKKNTKTLLLDLDETLITSCAMRDEPEKILPASDGGPPIMIKIRPFAREFLQKMKEHFEIMVFTASMSSYAEAIVKELDPEKRYISYIFDRSFCLETKNGFYIKDLRIIKNRELKNMVIVDNLVHSFGFQVENGIPIIEWTGNKADVELKYLMNYLIEAKTYDDMRDYNKQKLRLVELCNSNIEEFIDI